MGWVGQGQHLFLWRILLCKIQPQNLPKKIKIEGIDLHIQPNGISFECQRNFKLDELRNIWIEIEQKIPDLGEPAEQCKIPQAQSFRERHKKIS